MGIVSSLAQELCRDEGFEESGSFKHELHCSSNSSAVLRHFERSGKGGWFEATSPETKEVLDLLTRIQWE